MAIEAIIARYGLAAVLAGAFLEGETAVITGGLLAHQGLMPLLGVMLAGAVGSFLADQFFFLLGRRFRDHPRVRQIVAKPAFVRALGMLERHPTGFIFAFRFLYGLRTVSPIAIGTSSVRARSFVVLNAIAAILWAIGFTCVGYGFGHGIELAFGRLRSIEHIAGAVATIVVAVLTIAWFIRHRRRKGARVAD